MDASAGQITQKSTVADVPALDFATVNPVAGPVYVDGAEPGDAHQGDAALRSRPSGWGWTANIPGFGLLADQFMEPALHIWKYDARAMTPAMYGPGGARAAEAVLRHHRPGAGGAGLHSIVPPRRVGGNMDIRDMSGGHGALPAGRGDGRPVLGRRHPRRAGRRRGLRHRHREPDARWPPIRPGEGRQPQFPRFTTAGPVSRHFDAKGYEVTTGIGPDLMEGARAAVERHDRPAGEAATSMKPLEAYMLCSVCADLRISEIVDMPNWVVSCSISTRVVFEIEPSAISESAISRSGPRVSH